MSNPGGLRKIDVDGRHSVYDEVVLDAIASPGQAVVLAADGKADPGAGGPINILVEDALQGRTLDTAFAVGDLAGYITPNSGDRVLVLCLSGQTITKGGNVVINASGKGISTGTADFISLEDSGGALAADTHLLCRKI